MPRPPPPDAALTNNGKPNLSLIFLASSYDETPPLEPGTTGIPAFLTVSLAVILSPIICMCFAVGPMNSIP